MKKWAESLIETHRNPIVKVNLTGDKIYKPGNTPEEEDLVLKNIKILSDAIKSDRVERRCARSKALWLPDKKLAKITKAVGLQNFGFQDKTGAYLQPDETLFLLETNRLELLWNEVPFSIQQGYNAIIDDKTCTLPQYEVYKKLAIQGYKLSRSEKNYEYKIQSPTRKKAKIDHDKNSPICLNSSNNSLEESRCKNLSIIDEVFKKLKEDAPKEYDLKLQKYDLYKLYMPASGNKNLRFNLHMINDKEVLPELGFYKEDTSNMFGIVTPDSVVYYRFSGVKLPVYHNCKDL